MTKPDFVYVTYINTTAERLWEALTDKRFTQEYWAGRAIESDWKVGSIVDFKKRNGDPDMAQLQVLEVDQPQKLVLRWSVRVPAGATAPPATKVTFAIEAAGPKNVKLTVTHEEHEPGSSVDGRFASGWPAILSSLKTLLETGEALDVTKRWEQMENAQK
jgi:uncharacterized protein YndB with AHSA1/START domain